MKRLTVKAYPIQDKRGSFELSMHPERVLLGVGPVKRSLCLFAEQPVREGDDRVVTFEFEVVAAEEVFQRYRNEEFIASFTEFGNTYFLYGVKRGD